MEAKELALFIAETLADKKAEDILLLDVEGLVGYTSWFVIATGRSDRQVKAVAEHLERRGREALHRRPIGVEGVERGVWALLDYGDVIVHVFREAERAFYDLEGLWEDAPRIRYETPPPPGQPAAHAHSTA